MAMKLLEASSSSSSPDERLSKEVGNLSIQDEPSSSESMVPEASSTNWMRVPTLMRPEQGSCGTKCFVKANHFFTELLHKEIYRYDVSITPENTSPGVNRALIKELVKQFRYSHLAGRLPAYDGRESLYTAGPLPFRSNEFKVNLVDKKRPNMNFRIFLQLAARGDDHDPQGLFLSGSQSDAPDQKAQHVLDIVLRQSPASKYTPMGPSSFYSKDLGRNQQLGEGLESWRGFYQSIMLTQMGLSLNIDMSTAILFEPIPIVTFLQKLLQRNENDRRKLTIQDLEKTKKALTGVTVEVTHRGNVHRKYRISGLTAQATRDLTFPDDVSGTMKLVEQYFYETYHLTIKYTNWPCLQVGNKQKPNYLPMEVCNIVEGQRCSKSLNETQQTALLKVTCQPPHDRERDIMKIVHRNQYNQDQYAKEFGITITDDELASVEARILPTPRLKYHETGKEKDCLPTWGHWNMENKKLVSPCTVKGWSAITFDNNIEKHEALSFSIKLAHMCNSLGMKFPTVPLIPPIKAKPEELVTAIKHLVNRTKKLDILLVILPERNNNIYGDLKRLCETKLGLVSQCCLGIHAKKGKKNYLQNVALKINVKLGGRNTVLIDALSRSLPIVSDEPTIIFGADVTHPHHWETSIPSIAAVVASRDWPEINIYAGLFCPLISHQELDAFGGLIREHLQSFKMTTGQKPKKIIYYTGGVGVGQSYQVLQQIDALKKACSSYEPGYQPPITFVVVQKRHHTRFFREDYSVDKFVGRSGSGNILPGTVVDSEICHPNQFDFYLCSHAGIQGTSRPAHYRVLLDENKFSSDALQTLTNNLCYTYVKSASAVSIVPAVTYAQLVLKRARLYLEPETSDSGENTPPLGSGAVRTLPALKDNIKGIMYYC